MATSILQSCRRKDAHRIVASRARVLQSSMNLTVVALLARLGFDKDSKIQPDHVVHVV